MVTDPISNLIITLKNGNKANKESVVLYSSKLKEAIAKTLESAGFVKSASAKKSGKMMEVELAYKTDKSPRITDVQRISKPSRRIYIKSSGIKPFKSGFGTIILSTPKGILTDKQAKKEKVGGEVLFKIW